jgi:hypothetical protein
MAPFLGADGEVGELRVGGRTAAQLRAWRLTPGEPGRFELGGTLTDAIDLLLDGGRPVEVRLKVGKRTWRWKDGALVRRGAAATVTVIGDWEML